MGTQLENRSEKINAVFPIHVQLCIPVDGKILTITSMDWLLNKGTFKVFPNLDEALEFWREMHRAQTPEDQK